MDEQGSITKLIAGFKDGDEEAARQIWDRYWSRLVALARKHLRNAPRRVADEEDVVISVFEKVSKLAREGGFRKLDDRDDLWQVLVLVTLQKVANQRKHQARQKRGGGRVRGESIFANEALSRGPNGIAQLVSEEPTPQFAIEVAETCRVMLDKLPDEAMRDIAVAKMEGYANKEIAKQLGVTERTVERKLKRIRGIWQECDTSL